jgi:hypothetical protein
MSQYADLFGHQSDDDEDDDLLSAITGTTTTSSSSPAPAQEHVFRMPAMPPPPRAGDDSRQIATMFVRQVCHHAVRLGSVLDTAILLHLKAHSATAVYSHRGNAVVDALVPQLQSAGRPTYFFDAIDKRALTGLIEEACFLRGVDNSLDINGLVEQMKGDSLAQIPAEHVLRRTVPRMLALFYESGSKISIGADRDLIHVLPNKYQAVALHPVPVAPLRIEFLLDGTRYAYSHTHIPLGLLMFSSVCMQVEAAYRDTSPGVEASALVQLFRPPSSTNLNRGDEVEHAESLFSMRAMVIKRRLLQVLKRAPGRYDSRAYLDDPSEPISNEEIMERHMFYYYLGVSEWVLRQRLEAVRADVSTSERTFVVSLNFLNH